MFESILCQVTEYDPDVLESLIELAVEIAREGREGRRVGADVRQPLVRLSMCATEAKFHLATGDSTLHNNWNVRSQSLTSI